MTQLLYKAARTQAQRVLEESWEQTLPVNIESMCHCENINIHHRTFRDYENLNPSDLFAVETRHENDIMTDAIVDNALTEPIQRYLMAMLLGGQILVDQYMTHREYGFELTRENAMPHIKDGKLQYNGPEDQGFHFRYMLNFALWLLMPQQSLDGLAQAGLNESDQIRAMNVTQTLYDLRTKVLPQTTPDHR